MNGVTSPNRCSVDHIAKMMFGAPYKTFKYYIIFYQFYLCNCNIN